jgi:hypothetical protein
MQAPAGVHLFVNVDELFSAMGIYIPLVKKAGGGAD